MANACDKCGFFLKRCKCEELLLEKQIAELKSELEGKEDSAHFAITSLETKIAELERIVEAAKDCVRITQDENDKLQAKAAQQKNDLVVNKVRLGELLKEIKKLQVDTDNAFEHIWDNLKVIRIQF